MAVLRGARVAFGRGRGWWADRDTDRRGRGTGGGRPEGPTASILTFRLSDGGPPSPSSPPPGLSDADAERVMAGERALDRETDGSVCSICTEEWADGVTVVPMPNCAHCLHPDCVRPWLAISSTCPCCRASTVPVPASVSVPVAPAPPQA